MNQATRAPGWATIIATSFGAGFSPLGPGTMGTLTAIPLAWAVSKGGPWLFLVATLIISAVGTVAADVFQKAHGTDDDQRIVVDEVAGYFVTLLLVPHTGLHFLLAFVLFRFFDIWKPWPVRLIDRTVDGGWGVMADDLAAGGYAAICLLALDRFGVVARLATHVP